MCGAQEEGAAFNAYAADAWAAGVTLWCFVYGTVPFFGCVSGIEGGVRSRFGAELCLSLFVRRLCL